MCHPPPFYHSERAQGAKWPGDLYTDAPMALYFCTGTDHVVEISVLGRRFLLTCVRTNYSGTRTKHEQATYLHDMWVPMAPKISF